MAALPPNLVAAGLRMGAFGLSSSAASREEKDGTCIEVKTNELGSKSFFPSSEVTSMPTLKVKHTKKIAGMPSLLVKGSLNDEYCSAGVGLRAQLGKLNLQATTERLIQREGSVEGPSDKGWAHQLKAKFDLTNGVVLKVQGGRKATDSLSKDIIEGRCKAIANMGFGIITPEFSCVSRSVLGADMEASRKVGKKIRVKVESSPRLTSTGVSLYGVHTSRSWAGDVSFASNEIGVSLPLASSKLSVGAVQVNSTQAELLEHSTLASVAQEGARVGLAFRFESQL